VRGRDGGKERREEGGEDDTELSRLEIARYGRQMILQEIGIAGQRRLKQASVLIVGAGGLGAPVAIYLASCGVGEDTVVALLRVEFELTLPKSYCSPGHLGLVDYDDVELGNLPRQIIHDERKLKVPKVESAAETIRRFVPFICE